jgi:predicted DNA-binding transcriptional regulator AlpA
MYEMIGLVESGYERVVCRRSELAWQVVDGGGSMARRKKQPTARALLLTIPDVAIQLGVCRPTVYNLIYYKGLPSVLLGSVHPDSLREWLKQCEQKDA